MATRTLRNKGAVTRAQVTGVRTELLGKEKGLTGQLARIHLDYDVVEEGAPRTLVAKSSAPDARTRTLMHTMGFYRREVGFYEDLADHSPLRTPRCYFSAVDGEEGASLLLLEDLEPARNGSWVAGCSLAEAELAIRAIAAFHARWWRHAYLTDKPWLELRGLTSIEQAPVVSQEAWEPFLDKLGSHATAEIRQTGAWLSRYLSALYRYLYRQPPCTLVHNDYQADNLFDTMSVAVLDWQLVTHGRAAMDVAWLLGGNLDPVHRRDHERRLLRSYHARLVGNGAQQYTFEQCWDDYRLAMLHPFSRVAAAVGYGVVPDEQEKGYCEMLIPRYCRAVHDLGSAYVASAVLRA
jgi:hypothetical protein